MTHRLLQHLGQTSVKEGKKASVNVILHKLPLITVINSMFQPVASVSYTVNVHFPQRRPNCSESLMAGRIYSGCY